MHGRAAAGSLNIFSFTSLNDEFISFQRLHFFCMEYIPYSGDFYLPEAYYITKLKYFI